MKKAQEASFHRQKRLPGPLWRSRKTDSGIVYLALSASQRKKKHVFCNHRLLALSNFFLLDFAHTAGASSSSWHQAKETSCKLISASSSYFVSCKNRSLVLLPTRRAKSSFLHTPQERAKNKEESLLCYLNRKRGGRPSKQKR